MTYIEPLSLVCLAMLIAGMRRVWKGRQACQPRLLATGVGGLVLLLWPPAAWLLSRPLEGRYPRRPASLDGVEALVVLSSAMNPPTHTRPFPLPDRDTYLRCRYAAWLYHQVKRVPVLVTGGVSSGGQICAVAMRDMLEREGVPASMIWTEERSQSTYENAAFSTELLRQRGIRKIAVITEADHMLRSEMSFRKQGLAVTPAPSMFHTLEWTWQDLLPGWRAIQCNERTLHETVGLAWYWMRGRI